MDELPKLLPIWHNATLKDQMGSHPYGNDASIFPDHTGAGVDITFKGGRRECIELKSSTVKASFGAKCCSLPFLQPNKVKSLQDPCFHKLKNQQKKQTKFCNKLNKLITHYKRKTQFHRSVSKAYSDINRLENIEECAKLSVPKSVMDLAETMPEHFAVPKANWSYTNGCLANLPNAEGSTEGLLFHPVGTKMNKLAVTPIQEITSDRMTIVADEAQQKCLKFEGGKIYQISTTNTQGTRLCCIRQGKKFHILYPDLSGESEDFPYRFRSFAFEKEISDVALSPFNHGQHSVITKDGYLFIQDANTQKQVWQLDEPLEHDPIVTDMWWGCSYGRCFPSLLCIDRMNLLLFDMRRKNKPTGIFSAVNPFLLKGEELMMMRPWPANDYQHLIATSRQLLICDERYPEQPIIQINHMMEGYPMYCSIAPYSTNTDTSERAILLASQEKQEIASFLMRSTTSAVQPFLLGPPLHLSSLNDSIQSLRYHGNDVKEQLIKRLSVPLIGVCAIPHTQKQGFTALQVSSLGDVFYQCFQDGEDSSLEKTWKIGPGCVITPPENILPELNNWMDGALVKEKFTQKKLQIVDKSDVFSELLALDGRSTRCEVCKDRTLLEGEEEVDLEICPSCGLQCETSQGLIDALKTRKPIVHRSLDNTSSPALNLVDLSKSHGPLSKKLLEAWNDEYFTVPQNTDDKSQNTDDKSQSGDKTFKLNQSTSREPWPIGSSIDHIIDQVSKNVNGSSDHDSSRTPSIDGLAVMANINHLIHGIVDNDLIVPTQNELVPPSQDVRPKVGETLRTPKRHKKIKLNARAGF